MARLKSDIKHLEKKIFIYDTSEFDKRYFKNAIAEYNKGNVDQPFTVYLMKAVWDRNEKGTTNKYCYFSDKHQRIYLEKTFFTWCRIISYKGQEELKSINNQNQDK